MPESRPIPLPALLYGTAWKEERTRPLAELALQAGFRGIDTANQRKHYHEAAVGEALAAAYRAGVVTRDAIFLQTKFTYRDGHDERLPYDANAGIATQVVQSMASSLEHLRTDRVDGYLLHGPASRAGWSEVDAEAWAAMMGERNAGRARFLGVSNVSLRHLLQMTADGGEAPALVQNRCFARTGWDREVRAFCRRESVVYQGFSLLTANAFVLRDPLLVGIAKRLAATPAQVVFAFARAVGMVALTGTSDAVHMRQDLASEALVLSDDEVRIIESLGD